MFIYNQQYSTQQQNTTGCASLKFYCLPLVNYEHTVDCRGLYTTKMQEAFRNTVSLTLSTAC